MENNKGTDVNNVNIVSLEHLPDGHLPGEFDHVGESHPGQPFADFAKGLAWIQPGVGRERAVDRGCAVACLSGNRHIPVQVGLEEREDQRGYHEAIE